MTEKTTKNTRAHAGASAARRRSFPWLGTGLGSLAVLGPASGLRVWWQREQLGSGFRDLASQGNQLQSSWRPVASPAVAKSSLVSRSNALAPYPPPHPLEPVLGPTPSLGPARTRSGSGQAAELCGRFDSQKDGLAMVPEKRLGDTVIAGWNRLFRLDSFNSAAATFTRIRAGDQRPGCPSGEKP